MTDCFDPGATADHPAADAAHAQAAQAQAGPDGRACPQGTRPGHPPGPVRDPGPPMAPRRLARRPAAPPLAMRSQRHRARGAAPAVQLNQGVGRMRLALRFAEQQRLSAVQACERQASFMAVLAHELRAPLSPIRNAAALLGRPCTPETLAFIRNLLERQSSHAARLVDDLLDVARIRTGQLRLQRAVVNLGEVLACAQQACQPRMDERLQALHVDAPALALQVDGDAVRLVQIVSNLLVNASLYTPPGGAIALTVAVRGPRVHIAVIDTGIGIAPEDLPRIFEPYYRDGRARACDAAGLGLGLSLARDLVLAHEGRISVSSDGPGRGSRFELSLPLLPAACDAAPGGEA